MVLVMAFGQLPDGNTILQAAEVLRQYPGAVAVVPPLAGTGDLLAESIQLSSYARIYNKLASIHHSAARTLIREERDRTLLLQDITDMLDSFRWLGRSLQNRGPTPAEAAHILNMGERLAARLLTSHLQHRGVRATLLHSADVLHGEGAVDARVAALCAEGVIPVVGAGAALTAPGVTARLADPGAIHTGARLAASLGAEALWLWLDLVDAPPTSIAPAALAALAHTRPAALLPALDIALPIRLCDLNRPDWTGAELRIDPE